MGREEALADLRPLVGLLQRHDRFTYHESVTAIHHSGMFISLALAADIWTYVLFEQRRCGFKS